MRAEGELQLRGKKRKRERRSRAEESNGKLRGKERREERRGEERRGEERRESVCEMNDEGNETDRGKGWGAEERNVLVSLQLQQQPKKEGGTSREEKSREEQRRGNGHSSVAEEERGRGDDGEGGEEREKKQRREQSPGRETLESAVEFQQWPTSRTHTEIRTERQRGQHLSPQKRPHSARSSSERQPPARREQRCSGAGARAPLHFRILHSTRCSSMVTDLPRAPTGRMHAP